MIKQMRELLRGRLSENGINSPEMRHRVEWIGHPLKKPPDLR
jgi:hypothetical protein